MSKTGGEKFTAKYGVENASIYKGNPEALKIPPVDHSLYDPTAPTTFDPIRVEAIDRDGKMTTPIEIYTDPDEGVLWVLDGRGRFLDVKEVNRRRAKEGRELVKPYIVPFPGDEKAAIARIREKNYHRRSPTQSGMALDLLALRNAGHSWDACAKILHHETDDAQQWGRKLLPLAFCVAEVRAAIDSGELPKGAVSKFGGTALDGLKALGKKEQLELLKELTETKEKKPRAQVASTVGAKSRERVAKVLSNGASAELKSLDKMVAQVVAATMARIDGDTKALKPWPNVASIVEEALKPMKRGRKPKAKDEEVDEEEADA